MNKIAILDAGSQYGKLIDKNIRELDCETDLFSLNVNCDTIKNYKGIIISGGPDSVYAKEAIMCDKKIFDLGIPILGICYGMQLMNYLFGGTVVKKTIREDGQKHISISIESKLFENMDRNQQVLLTHGDSIEKIAPDFKVIATSDTIISAIEHNKLPLFGVQFHPEVELTQNGSHIFKNFLLGICKLQPTFTLENRLDLVVNDIKNQVKDKKIIMLVSGGVDSSVCLALLHKILNVNQIHAVHIDHGFLRNSDAHTINYMNDLGFNINIINAFDEFHNGQTLIDGKLTNKLCNIIKPEQKRKIIGDAFMKVIDAYFDKIGLKSEDCLLVQGTLRPDLIESASKMASGKADVIKTHHNDTKLVREMRDKGLILEPLKDLHKNEVRKLGIELGLAHDLIYRHPFPGPGLAIRMICTPNVNVEEFESVKDELITYKNNLQSCNYEFEILPIKTVGVQGDCRTYSYLCSIKGDYTDDIYNYALDIPQKIKKVNRVIFNFDNKKNNDELKLVNVGLDENNITLLRNADEYINNAIKSLYSKISQMPIILLPIGQNNKKSIVIRPVITNDFMTALPYKMPIDILKDIYDGLIDKHNNISNLFIDLTSKPPGTIEYE